MCIIFTYVCKICIYTDGVFGAMMQVHIQNDGPVTIPLETPDNLPVSSPEVICKVRFRLFWDLKVFYKVLFNHGYTDICRLKEQRL